MWFLLRILIGSIFIVSGLGKLLSPYQNFLYVIQAYQLLPAWGEALAAQIFPWVELLIGIFLALQQVMRLFPEIQWVNGLNRSASGLTVQRPPVLLAPMATLLGDKAGAKPISTITLRAILDSIGTRLDESREIARYLTGLLVFLGLLGTFWGLLLTVSAVSDVIATVTTKPSSSAAPGGGSPTLVPGR